MFTTYILKSLRDGNYYIGSTRNLNDRLNRHLNGRSKATKNRLPLELVYVKKFQNYHDAYKFELWLKRQKSKRFIETLITKNNNSLGAPKISARSSAG